MLLYLSLYIQINNFNTLKRLNDAPSRLRQGRSRSRSRSRSRGGRMQNQNNFRSGSVHDRLGNRQTRQPRRGGMQSRMRRGGLQANNSNNNNNQQQQQQRSRSRSRQRINRNNFRNNNTAPLKRSNSVNNRLGNNGPKPQVQQQNIRRFRSRSRSRNNLNNSNNNRRNSFGNNNKNINRNQTNRPLTGRIVKRRINRRTGANVQPIRNAAARNVKKLQRWIL